MSRKNKDGYTRGMKRVFEKYRWWDYSYLLNMEREIWKHWFEVYSNSNKYNVCGLSPRRPLIAKLALKLLEAIDGSIIEQVNPEDDVKWEKCGGDDEGYVKLTHIPEYRLKKGNYVNVKNARRFLTPGQYNFMFGKENPDTMAFKLQDLYEIKAWHLYHRLREQYLQYMWD